MKRTYESLLAVCGAESGEPQQGLHLLRPDLGQHELLSQHEAQVAPLEGRQGGVGEERRSVGTAAVSCIIAIIIVVGIIIDVLVRWSVGAVLGGIAAEASGRDLGGGEGGGGAGASPRGGGLGLKSVPAALRRAAAAVSVVVGVVTTFAIALAASQVQQTRPAVEGAGAASGPGDTCDGGVQRVHRRQVPVLGAAAAVLRRERPQRDEAVEGRQVRQHTFLVPIYTATR